jgi:hypothetical protein
MNIHHFYVYNEQMNEEELPINKNYKELKEKRTPKYYFSIHTTYLIHIPTFSIHNQVQKMMYDYVRDDHHEDQVPDNIMKSFILNYLLFLKYIQ